MKILFVSNLYGEDARGGAEKIVASEAEALAALGYDVVVVSGARRAPAEPGIPPAAGSQASPASRGPRAIRYRPPNVYFYADDHRHGLPTRFVWHLFDIFNVGSARTLARIVDRERPDVVHTHNLMGLGFMIPRMLRRRGVRHVHTVHDVQLMHPSGLVRPNAARPRLHEAAYRRLMRRLMGSPDVVVFPSAFLRDLHDRQGFFPRSGKAVLPNPAPDVSLKARTMPRRLSLLFAGQLEAHKGVAFLLDAWERWEDRGDAVLEIAGAGELERAVRERVESVPGARFLGRLDRERLYEAMDRAAFTVVPSLVIENAPAVILESFSRGMPVIAAAAGGIPELVADGGNGFLFAPGDGDALIAAFERARSALERWQALFAASCRKAAAHGIGAHAETLLGAYANEKWPRA